MLLAALALLPKSAMAYGGGMCRMWPQNCLAISPNLRARHFVVEPAGDVEQLPPFLEPGARRVFHRPFTLSLDAAEPIGIYGTYSRRTCIIARDSDIAPPIRMPVFFLGREGEASEEVKEHAERVAFTRTSSLTDVEDFTYVRFHLKRGGSNFLEIQPFFICGLPGAVLCESSCPADLPQIVQPLIEWVLSGRHWPPDPEESSEPAPTPTAKPVQPPEAAPSDKGASQRTATVSKGPAAGAPKAQVEAAKREDCAPAGSKPAPSAVQSAPAPQAAQKSAGQAPPAPAGGQKPPVETPVPAAPAQKPVAEPQVAAAPGQKSTPEQPAVSERPAVPDRLANSGNSGRDHEQPVAPAVPATPLRQLVLVFERKNGTAIDAGDILQAEGNVTVNGTSAARVAGSLVLSLPEEALAEATKVPALEKALPHYAVSDARVEGTRAVVTVEPRFAWASDITVKIAGSANENVSGCDLALDVLQNKRLGTGWSKANIQNLRFRDMGAVYAPILPLNADRNGFLIDTGQDGGVARLLSLSSGCKLEARPFVSAEEVRTGPISRNLHEATGQILIALLSTDGEFSDQVGDVAAEGFWAGALDLAGSVSEGAWERKVLGRAQYPGVSHKTIMFETIRGGKLAAGPSRDQTLKKLIEGSRQETNYLPGAGSKPIERFQLDKALNIVRSDAGIVPREGLPREGLLLITGGTDPVGGHFCRHPVPPDSVSPAAGQWASGVRRIFAVEVWSDAAARAFEKASRAKPAEGAPAGIYTCNFPLHDATAALYGVLPQALAPGARTATFTYLTGRANGFLRP